MGGGIFELRSIRFPRTAPKGDIIPKFNSCLVAVLTLAKLYEKGSLARETLRSVAKSLPTLLLPLRSHGSQTHISTNVKRFLDGRWELLWNDSLKYAANATVTRLKRLDAKPKKNEQEGKRLVTREYEQRTKDQQRKLAEYLHSKGAFGKANQSLVSDLKPTSDPKNVEDLKKLHPRPMLLSGILSRLVTMTRLFISIALIGPQSRVLSACRSTLVLTRLRNTSGLVRLYVQKTQMVGCPGNWWLPCLLGTKTMRWQI